jgi:hypothetical protein
MELDLKSVFRLTYLLAQTPQHHPPADIQGRYWSAKIDDISL